MAMHLTFTFIAPNVSFAYLTQLMLSSCVCAIMFELEYANLSEASCGRSGCSSACRTERRTCLGCRPALLAWAGSSSPSQRSWHKRRGWEATFRHPHFEHMWEADSTTWDFYVSMEALHKSACSECHTLRDLGSLNDLQVKSGNTKEGGCSKLVQ